MVELSKEAEGRAYYYGVTQGVGHYLHDIHLRVVSHRNTPLDFPVALIVLDGGFLPRTQGQQEGMCELWRNGKWTILTFWDRSGDSRMSSCSAFVFELDRDCDFDSLVQLARSLFPTIFQRLDAHGTRLVHNI